MFEMRARSRSPRPFDLQWFCGVLILIYFYYIFFCSSHNKICSVKHFLTLEGESKDDAVTLRQPIENILRHHVVSCLTHTDVHSVISLIGVKSWSQRSEVQLTVKCQSQKSVLSLLSFTVHERQRWRLTSNEAVIPEVEYLWLALQFQYRNVIFKK